MAGADTEVAVIGGGVVGCAVAHALARRGVRATVIEAERELALGASGANSGILHSGFDSTPGTLETRLILRSSQLREELVGELGVEVWRCGARLAANGERERAAVLALAQNARINGVAAQLEQDGSLEVPGETLTDPVAFVCALAGAARAGGASIRLRARVTGLARAADRGLVVELEEGELIHARAGVNCAGLYADELARMAGEELVSVYPRKGEFLVFAAPRDPPLEQILLPVPTEMGKGVLVFPTLDRSAVIVGPTAREREDKRDWSVEADAGELLLAKARRSYPALEGLGPLGAYAGLRPAGRAGNYVIASSTTLPTLVHVAAIRSTGLSASLGIGEHVAALLADAGTISLGPVRALAAPACQTPAQTWWQRAASRSAGSTPSSPGAP